KDGSTHPLPLFNDLRVRLVNDCADLRERLPAPVPKLADLLVDECRRRNPVLGKVRGNLTASDRVDIRSDGSLTGDVVAARISIEDGAYFKGGIDIRKGGQTGQTGQTGQQQKANGEDKSVPAVETAAAGARA
ncbi:MAG TPA: polymer-forming cytoskeletal protein, partial [Candidatus Sulfotelmatobacter sp.]